MIENFNALIGMLVSDVSHNQSYSRIPVPVAMESDSDEAWQDFQESQSFHDKEYAITLRSAL